jgi:hypothetical protein
MAREKAVGGEDGGSSQCMEGVSKCWNSIGGWRGWRTDAKGKKRKNVGLKWKCKAAHIF